MFYFEQLLQQAIAGIDRTAMLPTITGIAYSILLISFLFALYQAAMRGGDLQALAVSAIKYLVVAIVLANWNTVFQQLNASFNQVAEFIGNSSGAGDMFLSWMDQLKQQFVPDGFAALLPAISASLATIVNGLLCFAAYLIYAVALAVFAFFYVLYGCLLYALGPIILAFLPILGVGQIARGYATNLMIWNAWGVLYATFGALITAIQFNRVEQVMNRGFLIGFFQGTADSILLGLVSVFYALAVALIPFIAHRLIPGDISSTAYSLVRAGALAAGHAASIAGGFEMGIGGSGAATAAAAASASGGAASGMLSAMPPPPPPSLAGGIRAGMISAMSGDSAPPQGTSGRQPSASPSPSGGSFARPPRSAAPPRFYPGSVSQAISFQAARWVAATGSSLISPGRPAT